MGPAQEAGAVHRVGLALEDGLEEQGELPGIVLQVRILDDDHVARGVLESGAEGRALPPIPLVEDQGVDEVAIQLLQELPGAVGAPVVHRDDLQPERHVADAAKQVLHGPELVVDGHDHREPDPIPRQVALVVPTVPRHSRQHHVSIP